MTTCNISQCNNTQNLWRITCLKTYPPYFNDFTICNNHLTGDYDPYKMIYDALLVARFNLQSGNIVAQNEWQIEKLIDTWEYECDECSECGHKTGSSIKCVDCGSCENIWHCYKNKFVPSSSDRDIGHYKRYDKYVCDNHLHRKILGVTTMGNKQSKYYKTIESTWTRRTNESKKRKPVDNKQKNKK